MASVDELCVFARTGQTAKIQKYLQTHNININSLNLYGESPLSTATFHNHLQCVELLLANRADPKLRLAAGHTAIHIACQMGNVIILKLFLSVAKDPEKSEEEQLKNEDRHIYECLSIGDQANLTPIHWAATQENISKRQKLFAYLDQRMPGVLDSRYNVNWFQSWAKTHPWVIDLKYSKIPLVIPHIRTVPKLMNKDGHSQSCSSNGQSLPLMNMKSCDQISTHEYERTPRAPATATTSACYEEMFLKQPAASLSPIEYQPIAPNLPITPTTGRLAPPKNSSRKPDYQLSSTPKSNEDRARSRIRMQPPIIHPHSNHGSSSLTQKTPYSQRLTSMISRLSLNTPTGSTYRAERAHVIPTGHLPPSPIDLDDKDHKTPDHDEIFSPTSSKRPSHNLLSNIVPANSTPSTEASSRQSSKPFASFGFDTSLNMRTVGEGTPSTPNANPTESLDADEDDYDDDDDDDDDERMQHQNNPFDYICQTASTFGVPSPGSFRCPR